MANAIKRLTDRNVAKAAEAIVIWRKYSTERRRAGLSVTPPPPPLTGLHLTLLKGRWVQAGGAHLPGAKRVRVDRLHAQTRSNT